MDSLITDSQRNTTLSFRRGGRITASGKGKQELSAALKGMIERIERLAVPDSDSEDKAPTENVSEMARKVAQLINGQDIRRENVIINNTVDGSIMFEIRLQKSDYSIELFNDGDIVFMQDSGGKPMAQDVTWNELKQLLEEHFGERKLL